MIMISLLIIYMEIIGADDDADNTQDELAAIDEPELRVIDEDDVEQNY